jgi:predicted  nucleic acid-binding Zn-ribbon protein
MNAVVKSVPLTSATAALRAYQERMGELERQVAPLRSQLNAWRANITAAVEEQQAARAELDAALSAFNAAVAAAPGGAHRDREERWAKARRELERLTLRVTALENAVKGKTDEIRAIEARAPTEPVPLDALKHAVLIERMGEACERRANAVRAMQGLEDEVDAFARAADELLIRYQNKHGAPLSGMAFQTSQLVLTRLREAEISSRRHMIQGLLPQHLKARIAEILREVEAL